MNCSKTYKGSDSLGEAISMSLKGVSLLEDKKISIGSRFINMEMKK